jgi:hypothetical protein
MRPPGTEDRNRVAIGNINDNSFDNEGCSEEGRKNL